MSDRAPHDSMGISDLDGFLTCIVAEPELIRCGHPCALEEVPWSAEITLFDHYGDHAIGPEKSVIQSPFCRTA